MDKLNLLQLFVSTAANGSFASVAKSTGLSPSTVSKAIARLEDDLGSRLFHRTTRQLQLTEAGYDYLETANHVLETLKQGEKRLSSNVTSAQGKLRINLPMSFGQLYVVPLLKGFRQRYPNIELDLSFSDGYTDIVESGIDVALRSGHLEDRRLVARRLCPIDIAVFASPSYLQDQGTPLSADEAEKHPWIHYRFVQSGKLLDLFWVDGDVVTDIHPPVSTVVDTGGAMAKLACDGFGLALMPHFLVRDEVARGELVQVSGVCRRPDQMVYLYYHSREYLPHKVRVFIDYMVEQLEALGESPTSSWIRPN